MARTPKESDSKQSLARPRRLGLALSGGGSRGVAHAGVLGVLRKEGIKPDLIAGCSVGAIMGAFYAAGIDLEKQRKFAQNLGWRSIRMLGLPRMGFFKPGEMERFLHGVLGDTLIEDLPIPLAIMATEFRTARSVVFREGPLCRALCASSAIPIVFSPVIEGNRVLVDGGLTDNLPSQVCRVMGADVVLAVNVIPSFGHHRTYKNLFDIAMGTFDMLALPSTDRGCRAADIAVVPRVAAFNPSDLTPLDDLVARGAAAMRRSLPALRRLLESG